MGDEWESVDEVAVSNDVLNEFEDANRVSGTYDAITETGEFRRDSNGHFVAVNDEGAAGQAFQVYDGAELARHYSDQTPSAHQVYKEIEDLRTQK